MHDILFESPEKYWFAGFLVKSVTALLIYVMSYQNTSISFHIEANGQFHSILAVCCVDNPRHTVRVRSV